jgi:hypothetical protein
MPIRTSNALVVTVSAGWTKLVPAGSCCSRFSIPSRIWCLIPVEWFAACLSCALEVGGAADRSLDLVERPRQREPEKERDQPKQAEVVDPDTEPAGNPAATQR